MSSTSHKLWCLIEGDKDPFLVTASSNIIIAELKEIIKEEALLQRVDAPCLILRKVRYFIVICSDIMGDTTVTLPIGQCGL